MSKMYTMREILRHAPAMQVDGDTERGPAEAGEDCPQIQPLAAPRQSDDDGDGSEFIGLTISEVEVAAGEAHDEFLRQTGLTSVYELVVSRERSKIGVWGTIASLHRRILALRNGPLAEIRCAVIAGPADARTGVEEWVDQVDKDLAALVMLLQYWALRVERSKHLGQ